jgi:predicted RNA-binding Zn ribbon-like protein
MVMDDSTEYEPIEAIDLIGGEICLDFANTASARDEGPLRERLLGYGDLVTWGERVGLITGEESRALRASADEQPTQADTVLRRGRVLRESIFRTFRGISRGESPGNADLDVLTKEHAQAATHRRLRCESTEVEFEWDRSPRQLDQLLWPVAQSAIELLVSDERARVKECATDNCNWLFLDASKNRSRRWCEMKECGNRAKARRHYAKKAGQTGKRAIGQSGKAGQTGSRATGKGRADGQTGSRATGKGSGKLRGD